MGKSYRPQRLGEEIKKIISTMLVEGRLKDPALQGIIGISGVDVSGDGSYATIYVTSMSFSPGDSKGDEEKKAVLKAFEKCKGFLRSEIGRNIKVRYVPELIFKYDESFEYGMKMDRLIDSLDIKPAEEEETESSEDNGTKGFEF